MYSVTSPSVTVPSSVQTDLCPSLTLLHDHAKNVITPVKSCGYFSTCNCRNWNLYGKTSNQRLNKAWTGLLFLVLISLSPLDLIILKFGVSRISCHFMKRWPYFSVSSWSYGFTREFRVSFNTAWFPFCSLVLLVVCFRAWLPCDWLDSVSVEWCKYN